MGYKTSSSGGSDFPYTGDAVITGSITTDNIKIDGNTVSSTSGKIILAPLSGQDLELTPTGAGNVNITANSLEMAGTEVIDTSRNIAATNITGSGYLSIGNINSSNFTVSQSAFWINAFQNNTYGSYYSTMWGRYNNGNSKQYVTVFGRGGKPDNDTAFVWANHNTTDVGKYQAVKQLMHMDTIDATPTMMEYSNNAATIDDILIPSNTMLAYTIRVSAIKDDGVVQADYEFQGIIANDGGTTSKTYENKTVLYEVNAAYDCDTVANDTDDSLQIQVTGLVATNVRWHAVIDINEVTY
jgi:hypothetical protein